MKDDEFDKFAKQFLTLAEKIIADEKDEDYVVNQPQADLLVEVNLYFMRIIDESVGESVTAHIGSPKERHGYVTAIMGLLDLDKKEFDEFSQIISKCSGVTFTARTDGMFYVETLVPNVFIKKGTA